MQRPAVPPAAIGLAAGLLVSTAAASLATTDAGRSWTVLLLILLGGGLTAGLAAPVRPAVGALLGGATGLFAACLITALTTLPASMAPAIRPSFLDPIILTMWGMLFVPLYAVAGAVGAAVRPHLTCADGVVGGLRTRVAAPRARAGIVAGAPCIIAGTAASALADSIPSGIPILISAFAGGLAAGLIARGGIRAGLDAVLLAGLVGLGVVAIWGMWQLSTGPGNGIPVPLWPLAVAVRGFMVLPVVGVAGALGGALGRRSLPAGHAAP